MVMDRETNEDGYKGNNGRTADGGVDKYVREKQLDQAHEVIMLELRAKIELDKFKREQDAECAATVMRHEWSVKENDRITAQLERLALPLAQGAGNGFLKMIEMLCQSQERIAEIQLKYLQQRDEAFSKPLLAAIEALNRANAAPAGKKR